MRRPVLVAAVVALCTTAAVAGCKGQRNTDASSSTSPAPVSATPSSRSPSASPGVNDRTVWLCRPGHKPDPCVSDLTTTVVAADGSRSTQRTGLRRPRADCFYAYPTVSGEQRANADLRIQAAERQVALVQAARFSNVCDVWSPMYRQRTLGDLFNLADGAPNSSAHRIAYDSLRAGWRSFLRLHDRHRPIVLIGHSQGASMLIRLVRNEIDPDPNIRRQLALALLLGGNLTVAQGRAIDGDFHHIPLCTKAQESGCVIAYSSFPTQPPSAAFFGRPGQGVSLLSGNTRATGLQVACVNPAAPGSTSAVGLHPYFPTALAKSGASTPWTAYPGHATAACRTGGGATWLQVSPTAAGEADAQLLRERLGSLWGFHDVDVNLALGDLVNDVSTSVARWRSDH